MQFIKSLLVLIVIGFFTSASLAQLDPVQYQGPSDGSVAGGVLQTTDNFSFSTITGPPTIIPLMELEDPVYEGELMNWDESLLPEYVYVEDPNATKNPTANPENTVLLRSFTGIPMTNFIPPDPHLAVGPNHIIATVNSEFSIYDKDGNELKNINAGQWFAPVSAYERGDPQVLYDHYEGRWLLMYMEQNDAAQVAGNLIAVSDDDNPIGDWYIYRLDTRKHGSNPPSNTWGDYPQMGYDDEAFYIMTRTFGFSGGMFGDKIRIIDKSELYAAIGGQLTWTDIWDIRDPGSVSARPDVIHPVISYTPGQGGWFFWANRTGTNYYIAYKIANPLTSPVLTGRRIPVQLYGNTPDANQLGGGSPRISSNGSHIKTAPVIRDGFLYGTHSIRNTTSSAYASVRYFKFNLSTTVLDEVGELGAAGYFYIFPTITVDQDHNIGVTFSRSADTEYIGAYYSSKLAGDPPGLQPSQPMAEGQGNYVVTFGGSRNRWGDYLGICIDPDNFYNIWMLSEYAAATNQWGTWISEIRMKPFTGVYAFTASSSIDFGNIEVGTTSDTITAILANYGDQDLVITDIPFSMGDFTLDDTGITFPITLTSYDSLSLDFTFSPTVPDSVEEIFLVTSNDPVFTGFTLSGHGYVINPAVDKVMYASSGPQNDGNLLFIDMQTGAGTNIGPSLFNDISSLTISPLNDELLGVRSIPSESEILRVNSLGGDAYLLHTLNLGDIVAIAFDTSGVLYGALESGDIYSIDLTNGTYQYESTALIELTAITFEPMTNDLWATIQGGFGVPKDQIFKIDLATGDTTLVGLTGFNTLTNGLAFDENGVLYGIKGSGPTVSDLFTIDVNTGEGTIVGSVGLMALTGLAFAETGFIVSVDGSDDKSIPTEFVLSQNYPNPFNPSTSIEFSVPVNSDVTLTIYNLLGQTVTTLVNEDKPAGKYSVEFNATGLPSGVYFYKLEAGSFLETKKMILLK